MVENTIIANDLAKQFIISRVEWLTKIYVVNALSMQNLSHLLAIFAWKFVHPTITSHIINIGVIFFFLNKYIQLAYFNPIESKLLKSFQSRSQQSQSCNEKCLESTWLFSSAMPAL